MKDKRYWDFSRIESKAIFSFLPAGMAISKLPSQRQLGVFSSTSVYWQCHPKIHSHGTPETPGSLLGLQTSLEHYKFRQRQCLRYQTIKHKGDTPTQALHEGNFHLSWVIINILVMLGFQINCNLLNLQSYLQSVYLVSLAQSVLSEQFHSLAIKLSTTNNHVFQLCLLRGRQKLQSPHGNEQDPAA